MENNKLNIEEENDWLVEQISLTICLATGGRMSYPNYTEQAMRSCIEEREEELYKKGYNQAIEDLTKHLQKVKKEDEY